MSYGINSIYVEPSGGTIYLVEGGNTSSVERFDGSGTSYNLTSSVNTGTTASGILVENNTGTNQNTVYVGNYYSYQLMYSTETVTGLTSTFTSLTTMSLPSFVAYPLDFKADPAGNIYITGAIGGLEILSPQQPHPVVFGILAFV